ncbi:MAG: methionyl-tRNA formyltransferase [Thermotogae bacterium]|nr:methionyl-tRNA formyltransferase [Thermotogota bacterium]
MNFRKIAILTSENSWFVPYARQLSKILRKRGALAKLFFDYKNISEEFEVVFILSYFKIIPPKFLSMHRHNIVVHESNLPKGKGWAPLFWQILEGKNKIPIVLFEASENVDDGDIYLKDFLIFEGHELYDEIREKQAKKTIELCLRFIDDYEKLKPKKQRGKSTFYRRRTPADSELDINKTIKEQFNLLRIVNNENFPAFFYYKGHKYIIKIYKADE